MKDFKFFNSNKPTTNYNGEWSVRAVRFVYNYIAGRFCAEHKIDNETYQLTQATHENGEMVRCTVLVTDSRYPHIKVTYSINIGNAYPYITEHRIYYE